VHEVLRRGVVIPAHPLALTEDRMLDERRQRALSRYYLAAGAGGLAVGVHTTQFRIREVPGLFERVLRLAAEEMDTAERGRPEPFIRVGGVCGRTRQALHEAHLLRELGYHAGLLNLAAWRGASDDEVLAHCAAVAIELPLFGFYLNPAIGGRELSYRFWRRFVEIDQVVAIKIAPFNRYQTLDVVRAAAQVFVERAIALYTGNDDQIVLDLLTPFHIHDEASHGSSHFRIVGGLLGHWAVWTRAAVELHAECQRCARSFESVPARLYLSANEVTDCNAAFFDAANNFAGCIPGILEVLRRQGLLANRVCLDPRETLSPGQAEEIDRVYRAYPHLNDDTFVAAHRATWLG
jgi:dihydrodipicolinate synthase/N-acetylneuraminate lyase